MEIFKDIISTVIATGISVSVGQPFGNITNLFILSFFFFSFSYYFLKDTLKVRIQVINNGQSHLNFVKTILKEDGILSLWRGSTVAFFGQICENTTSFVLNAQFQRLLGPQLENEISITRSFLVGSAAGLFTSVIVCPMETIKCIVQVTQVTATATTTSTSTSLTNSNNHAVLSVLSEKLRTQGIKSLYHGVVPQMARDIPGSAIYFGCYDALFHLFFNRLNFRRSESCLLAGGFAGQIYWLFALPMDRIKSIIQTQKYDIFQDSQLQGSTKKYTNRTGPLTGLYISLDVTKVLYKQYGISGFYQGGLFALIRAFPTNASLFYAYKATRQILDETWPTTT